MKYRVLGAGVVSLALLSAAFSQQTAFAQPAATPAAPEKPGYMVVIGNGVDPKKMGGYAAAAVPLLLKYKGKLLFATDEGKTEVLEGGPFPGSIRAFEFPSLQKARDFYFDPEYQKAIPLRAGNGKIDVIVSDSFVPDPKWTQSPPK